MPPFQFGFRKQISLSDATYDFTENIFSALDRKLRTVGIFADLSKAFDLVYDYILLAKLQHYDMRGKILNLPLKSYLTNRKQIVVINDLVNKYMSGWQIVSCGVPHVQF